MISGVSLSTISWNLTGSNLTNVWKAARSSTFSSTINCSNCPKAGLLSNQGWYHHLPRLAALLCLLKTCFRCCTTLFWSASNWSNWWASESLWCGSLIGILYTNKMCFTKHVFYTLTIKRSFHFNIIPSKMLQWCCIDEVVLLLIYFSLPHFQCSSSLYHLYHLTLATTCLNNSVIVPLCHCKTTINLPMNFCLIF